MLLGDIIDVLFNARPAGLAFEAANPRHEHEWTVFEDVKVPDGKILIPGVLDSTTNYVEHPELVAQRIGRYTRLVGWKRVIAGSDCGFSSVVGLTPVDPQVTWVKLGAMAEGALMMFIIGHCTAAIIWKWRHRYLPSTAAAPQDSSHETQSVANQRGEGATRGQDQTDHRLAVGVAAVATAAVVTMPSLSGAMPSAYRATSANAPAARVDRRGDLVSATHLRTLSAEDAAARLASDRFDPSAIRYGVDTYRLVYRTIDPQGQPTIASGLLVLPRNHARRLRTVSFTHGTELFKGDAPSVAQDVWGSAPAITYAAAGFAAVAPDYLGLGVGPGPHPWMHVPSETTASLDMLRAARGFVPRTGRHLQRQVLVAGFSQGASVALALARALQAGADRWFQLGAVAPISGAYDLQHAELPALLSDDPHPKVNPKAGVIYSALLLVSWNRLHHLYDSPAEVFQTPYDRTIEQLFDSRHTGQQVLAGTPDSVSQLLTPDAVQMLQRPTGPLAAALRVADSVCTDWTPRAPIRLYMTPIDEQAVSANSLHCHAALRAHGVHVPLISVGDVDHLDSNRRGTAATVRWFLRLS